ncbi:hypothetical protein [Actinoplanes sp. L3-i22]|uniref:hypothetical protein n=1 Tax=Actinoplanes sp. L3-i22 TaxID=2836373 RepID=UPI001C861B0E|nr:hypothetical protein [Actinoplanes sp. L3-i22]
MPRAIEARRLAGKFVLLVAGVWIMGLVAFIAAGAQGSWLPLPNLLIYLASGAALIPAGYFSVRLHATDDREVLDQLFPRAVWCCLAGVAIFAAGFFLVLQLGGAK